MAGKQTENLYARFSYTDGTLLLQPHSAGIIHLDEVPARRLHRILSHEHLE